MIIPITNRIISKVLKGMNTTIIVLNTINIIKNIAMIKAFCIALLFDRGRIAAWFGITSYIIII